MLSFSSSKFLLGLLTMILLMVFSLANSDILTDRPVIGILAHPQYPVNFNYPNRQYIAASYVKWIESAGGRVVPIPFTITREEAYKLFPKLNGLLLPGGNVDYNQKAAMIIDIAIEMNQKNFYFPIWATCLGFEWIGIHFSKNMDLLKPVKANDFVAPLVFTPNAQQARMIKSMPSDIYHILGDNTLNVTLNHHDWAILTTDFIKYLNNDFYLISTNVDLAGVDFVSTMEHKKYPLFTVQWHPEKNNYEFGLTEQGTPYATTMHTLESIQVSQYFANFFVQETRKSPGKFATWQEEQAALIYNYPTFRAGPSFVENYWFDNLY